VSVRDKVRDLARLSRYGPSASASEGRCPRTHQQLRTGSDGQTVLRAFGATQVTATTSTSSTGGGGGGQGKPGGRQGGGHPPPEKQTRVRRTGAAADRHTGEGRCVGRRVGAPVLQGGAAPTPPSKVG
jgi:hypothetical protein